MHIHDIMYNMEEREIKGRYSSLDGWAVTRLYPKNPADPHFQVSRRNGQVRETIAVYASYTPVSSIRLPADGMKRAVLVPSGADTGKIDPAVKVIPMASYGFSGKDLVWQTKKKNAKTGVMTPVDF
ncbi:hypothetical protein J2741_000010 [Methanolinea mesophila]|uniref:hypothetical protein n=1 Tax=Methanolinea mesophila TaxID=547055 RepID=UPI001AE8288B|nr:hypothetical protein [Methanolinea mesophila]MBP1927463.1 hypothetical protein [Methanolinea mesophila]